MDRKIGFMGLGTMGKPMAKRLLKAGYPLVVYDLCPEKVRHLTAAGAAAAATARELTARADVVISMLPEPADTEEVMLGDQGIVQDITEGKVLIDMSTSSPELTCRICEAVEKKGGEMLDAPVSGGYVGAENGTLTIIAGGKKKTLEKCVAILHVFGNTVHYAGKSGNGHLLKILNNLLYSINMCATAEILTVGEQLGLDLPRMVEVFQSCSAGSYCLSQKVPTFVLPNDFSAGLKTNLLLKDIGLALEAGAKTDCLQVFAGLAQQFFKISRNSGLGEEDNSAVIKIFRALSKIKTSL